MQNAGGNVDLPPVEMDYIRDLFMAAGICEHGAMGPVPLTRREIHAWAEIECVQLSPWEFGLIRKMSEAYLHGLNSGKDASSSPPWADTKKQADKVADIIRRL